VGESFHGEISRGEGNFPWRGGWISQHCLKMISIEIKKGFS